MLRRLLPLPVLGLVLFVGFPAAADPRDEPAKKDPKDVKSLEGTWEAKSALFAGKEMPPPAGGVKLILLTDPALKYTVKMEGKDETGTFTADPAKNPRTIDYIPADGTEKGKKHLAIYELKDDELKIAVGDPGGPRPKDFSGKVSPVLTFKKAK
jgi:uncharacterized protein (TIGR03067 family)